MNLPKVWISSITYSDSTTISFSKNDIVIIVGPNNSGKSASLKEMYNILISKSQIGKVVKSIDFTLDGSSDELLSYMASYGEKYYNGNPLPSYKIEGLDIYEGTATEIWKSKDYNELKNLTGVFLKIIKTEDRLLISNPAPNENFLNKKPNHPIHFLYRDDVVEQKFNSYFRQAFGTDLTVHRAAGSVIPLYVGEKPELLKGEDRVSLTYIVKLEMSAQLHEQGDGMRAFVGVLLSAFVSQQSIICIDEPEAFLHPPQARFLGMMLTKELPTDKQLFLTTHSGDFLKGVLDSNCRNLKIIRIKRYSDKNIINILDNESIKHLWKDPLLRHSNILDGLFHSKVVVCESDADCRFYSAILTAVYSGSQEIIPDIMFTHCGGKHRLYVAVRALRNLDVPVCVVADFDVLNNEDPLKRIVAELGGDWSSIKDKWALVKKSVDEKRPELDSENVKEKINKLLGSVDTQLFPKDKVNEINKILKQTSAWAHAKQAGKAFIPNGEPQKAYLEIRDYFNSIGLLLVEVGELEGFCKTVGNHGPTWVNDVIEKDLKNDPELQDARDFVKKLV